MYVCMYVCTYECMYVVVPYQSIQKQHLRRASSKTLALLYKCKLDVLYIKSTKIKVDVLNYFILVTLIISLNCRRASHKTRAGLYKSMTLQVLA
jgi:hypothetical protein